MTMLFSVNLQRLPWGCMNSVLFHALCSYEGLFTNLLKVKNLPFSISHVCKLKYWNFLFVLFLHIKVIICTWEILKCHLHGRKHPQVPIHTVYPWCRPALFCVWRSGNKIHPRMSAFRNIYITYKPNGNENTEVRISWKWE